MYINKKQLEKGQFGESVNFSPLFNHARKTEIVDRNIFRSMADKSCSIKQSEKDYKMVKNKMTGEFETRFKDVFATAGHGEIIKVNINPNTRGIEVNCKTGKKDENKYLSV